MTPKRKSAVFIDRDGVINDIVDRGENFFAKGKKARWTAPFKYDEFRIKEGVREALEKIKMLGFLLILISNQPDIVYGMMTEEENDKIMEEIKKLPFDDIFVCYHGREDGCNCKKPKPGMLLEAEKKWNIDLSTSYMIGDRENDMTAGRLAGCQTILVDSPQSDNIGVQSDFRVKGLSEASSLICKLQTGKENSDETFC